MSDEVRAALAAYMETALELRFGVALPVSQSAPSEISECLLDVRTRLDRVEAMYTGAIRIKARAHRAAAHAKATFDDAWDTAAVDRRTAPVRRGDEYATAKERHAEANLATLDLRHSSRAADELAHHCDEAVDVLRLAHRGLDGVRQDILTMLRAAQFESHLERA
jgi:hypothetical protein